MAQQAAFEDSNISQLGSYEDIQARLAAAKTEKEWAGAGTHVGLEVWRVYDFKIHKVAPEEHGQFYSGDSYIVLNSYKAGADKFGYDVHFWLGQESSQDERGTAAYKTVELDDLLGTVPVQHREVQNHESALFLSYFKPNITLLKGGMPSGFKHVGPEKYKPRLIHVKQSGTAVKAVEVALGHASLNTNDVFVLDVGLKIFVWNGAKCSPMEKYKGNTVAEHIQSKRNDRATIVFTSESEEDNEFWTPLGGKGPINTVDTAPRAIGQDTRGHDIHVFRLSDKHAGHLKMEKAFTGQRPLHKAVLASDDVFIVDHPDSIFVWVGSGASPAERKNAMKFAFDYVHQNVSDKAIPITRILDGQEPKDFSALFH